METLLPSINNKVAIVRYRNVVTIDVTMATLLTIDGSVGSIN